MKALVVIRHPAQLRSLEGVLALLADRGHRVHIVFGRIKTSDAHATLASLAADRPTVTFGRGPSRTHPHWGSAGWGGIAKSLRLSADYLRYLEPPFAEASALRARARGNAPTAVRRAAGVAQLGGVAGVRGLRRAVALVDRCIPVPPHVEQFVAEQAPDVVLVTNMVEFGSVQTDYVRAAKHLGIHTGYLVFSWDNLTNKGLVHELPELVLVWNDSQAREAVEVQGIPRERVAVTGAPGFDRWFDQEPSRSRERFCADVGLSVDRPIVLYVCSSHFVAREEVGFVRRWIRALRDHGGVLADAGLLIRPHPRNAAQWGTVKLDEPQTSIWPRLGEEPIDEHSRENYFDSIYFSGAVVGINTSAQIESAIVGRPVLTVLADDFRETQQKTLHFEHLITDDYGPVLVDVSLEAHAKRLEHSLREQCRNDRNEHFVRHFVRPLGLNVPATPVVVEAIERLGAAPRPIPENAPPRARAVRSALRPVVAHRIRRADRLRSGRDARDELDSVVRRLQRGEVGAPVVAGPWLGDEVSELLYWIPFLQWCEAVTVGLTDHLVVAYRAGNAAWYGELGGRLLEAERLEPAVTGAVSAREDRLWKKATALVGADTSRSIRAELVRSRRAELARRHPSDRFSRRLLEFRPLRVPALPSGLELPSSFLVAHMAHSDAFPDSDTAKLVGAVIAAVAERHTLVLLDPPSGISAEVDLVVDRHGVQCVDTAGDREAAVAVIGRGWGFLGSYGPLPHAAALLGRPAIGFFTGSSVSDGDLRIANAFLGRPHFGEFRGIEVGGSVEQLVGEALAFFDGAVGGDVGLVAPGLHA